MSKVLVVASLRILALSLCCGFAIPAKAQADHYFTIRNYGSHVVKLVYISDPSSKVWGNSRLGRDSIPPGGTEWFRLDEGCIKDVRAKYDDGSAQENRGFDTCNGDWTLLY